MRLINDRTLYSMFKSTRFYRKNHKKIRFFLLFLAVVSVLLYVFHINSLDHIMKKRCLADENDEDACGWVRAKRECTIGSSRGCFNFGVIYLNGQGVEENHKKAVRFFKMSCDGGYMKACNNLGYMYEYGEGVEQNREKALEYYTVACDGEDIKGCYNLQVLSGRKR